MERETQVICAQLRRDTVLQLPGEVGGMLNSLYFGFFSPGATFYGASYLPSIDFSLQAELIRVNATTYVTEITELLNKVPRQLLLLLKTNDLLRSIDFRLKTRATSCSFITMSRCCIRALTEQRLQECRGWRDWVSIHVDSTFGHLRITLYQVYVSELVTSIRRILTRLVNRFSFL